MSKIKDNSQTLLSGIKGIVVDLLRDIFSKDTLEKITNNFKTYYIKHVNIHIMYILSIAYVIYSFFMKDIIFICIFIFLFIFIYFFKKSDAIIYIFPLILCNIIYEIFLKRNRYFKRLIKHVYIEGYESSRVLKWNGWENGPIEPGRDKEKLRQEIENQDEKERTNKNEPLEGGEELDFEGDGDKVLEQTDEGAEGADENSEEENIKQVNDAAAKGKNLASLMSKRIK